MHQDTKSTGLIAVFKRYLKAVFLELDGNMERTRHHIRHLESSKENLRFDNITKGTVYFYIFLIFCGLFYK